MQEPNYIVQISKESNLKEFQVSRCFELIDEGATVPFIARYRQEVTGKLDEIEIRKIVELKEKIESLYKAKVSAIANIDKQGKLTPELQKNIESAKTLKEVEDIYKPYKLKKKTKAMIAEEKGFMPVAKQIKNQDDLNIPQELLDKYPEEEIITGAIDIVAQQIVDNSEIRDGLRKYINRFGIILSKYKSNLDKIEEKVKKHVFKFKIYGEFSCLVSKLKQYQILALNRGEKLGIINVKIVKDEESLEHMNRGIVQKSTNREYLLEAVSQAYKALFKSVETETRNQLTEEAEDEAIITFQKNLNNLLLIKPQPGRNILAIDPGYRTGCKLAILDKQGNPQKFTKIFLENSGEAVRILEALIAKYNIEVIVIGNGTAGDKTVELIKSSLSTDYLKKVEVVLINESGASVYSASEAGNEEFPDLEITDRGTISIGRRYIDPLAELVKITPDSIGVGMYQHDMNQKELEKKLTYTVEDVVNLVGINVNTASVHVLKYISGLTARSATKVYNNRPFDSRKDLKKQLTGKVFQQCAGFLRVVDSSESLDNTNIHPEQYKLAKFIIKKKLVVSDFTDNEFELKKLYPDVAPQTVKFILDAFKNIGNDPRTHSGNLTTDQSLEIEDLKEGDIIQGIVRNVVQFGAFVDVGLKNDGLVHISQLANKYVSDPLDVVEVGEEVKVKVMKIDLENQRVQLSMKEV